MPTPNERLRAWTRRPRNRLLMVGLVVAAVLAWWLWRPGAGRDQESIRFTARRGPLEVKVLEGGSVQAIESQEIKCEVRVGYQGVKILKIVDEGYQVTEEDVRTNKVLVEFDSSDIQKQIVEQEIRYQSAAASLTEAQQAFEIQINQNLSDIKAAEQKARFGRMDFEKFLGAKAADTILAELGLTNIVELLTNDVVAMAPLEIEVPTADAGPGIAVALAAGPEGLVQPAGTTVAGNGRPATATAAIHTTSATTTVLAQGAPAPGGAMPTGSMPTAHGAAGATPPQASSPPPAAADALPEALTQRIDLDFTRYADLDMLGDGEAKQKLRKFLDDLMVARRELEQARSTAEGTRRLFSKQFVTRIDMERDDIALTNSYLKVQTAETAKDLFLRYEFSKSAEEALSKYLEAVRELDRARKAAISKMAQAQARKKSAEAQFNVQLRQRKELYEQLSKCLIQAQKPGLVVYGGGDENYWRGEEQIREGATVRERQAVITIPDMTKMEVRVKIHESYIKKVKKGQKATITLDAFPDQILTGEVTYVGVLPDSQNRWMNPDMKVYRTTVTVDGTHDWLKPGMSAKVEVLVDLLPDVVYVPIQAVIPHEGKQVCYLDRGGAPETREVAVGQFNDSFIEIREGLREGDIVYLKPPGAAARSDGSPEGAPAKDQAPETPAAPAGSTPSPAAPAVAIRS